MSRWRTLVPVSLSLCLSLCLVLAAPASTQILNGDFEAGSTAWTVSAPSGWSVDFRTSGGNPDGYLSIQSASPDPVGGEACVSQMFTCGGEGAGTCTVEFDYFSQWFDAAELTGRVRVFVDGAVVFVQPAENSIPWTPIEFTVLCGIHEISLCLEVDPHNNSWNAGFDNALAMCDNSTPIRSGSWGQLKVRFR